MRKRLLYSIFLFLGIAGLAQAATPEVTPTQVIADATPTVSGGFGWNTVVSGDYMFITKSAEKTTAGGTFRGKICVYKNVNNQWTSDGDLFPEDVMGLWYGYSAACDGTRLAVGVPESTATGDKCGYILVYEKDATGKWVQQGDKIRQTTPLANAKWGTAVAIDGDVIAVGGHNYKNADALNCGTATILERSSEGKWESKFELTPATADVMGRAVAVDGNCVLLGSPVKGVYVIAKTQDGSWKQQALVEQIPSNVAAGQAYSLSLCEDQFLMGCAPDAAAYLYKKVNDTWTLAQTISKTEDADKTFGNVAVLKKNGALISTNNKGTAYLFSRNATTGALTEVAALKMGDTDATGNFGYSASFDGKQCLIGRNTYKTGTMATGLALYYNVESLLNSTTAIANTPINDAFQTYTVADGIVVKSQENTLVQIYNLTGKRIASQQIAAGETTFALPQGAYIVTASGKALKVIL